MGRTRGEFDPIWVNDNITTQNLVPTGAGTAGSFVPIPDVEAAASLSIQVGGTWTAVGGLVVQGTLDGITWTTLGGPDAVTNEGTNLKASSIPSGANGLYRVSCSGLQGVRVTALGAVTGSATIILLTGAEQASIGVDAGPSDQTINLGTYTALNTNLLTGVVSGWFDASGFASLCATLIGSAGISAGQVIFEQTNDPTNASAGVTLPVVAASSATNLPATSNIAVAANTVYQYAMHLTARYVRVRISTAFVGGNVRCVAQLYRQPINILVPSRTTISLSDPLTTNVNSAASTNSTLIRGATGNVLSIVATNTGAAIRYLKLYNKATAPTVGTDTPFLTFAIPAGGFIAPDLGAFGVKFSTGIGIGITGGAADSDTTVIAANEVKVAVSFV